VAIVKNRRGAWSRIRRIAFETICTDLCDLALPPPFAGDDFAALLPGVALFCTMHNPVVRRKLVDGALRVVGRFPGRKGRWWSPASSKLGSRWRSGRRQLRPFAVRSGCQSGDDLGSS
jgi:hypothetical protein